MQYYYANIGTYYVLVLAHTRLASLVLHMYVCVFYNVQNQPKLYLDFYHVICVVSGSECKVNIYQVTYSYYKAEVRGKNEGKGTSIKHMCWFG
jgi:hypothetical protein